MKEFPEALTIAGTDSGGGAGMMADIKTMQACHVFSTSVVVGVTAQNTLDVQKVFPMPLEMVDAQFASIADDFVIKAAKTGALFDAEHVANVAKNIKKYSLGSLVVDPVMVAKGGAKLLTDDAIDTVISDLIPLADIITPNMPEAETIVKHPIDGKDAIMQAAQEIQKMGAKNVVIKGGHSDGPENKDYVLLADGNDFWMTGKHVDSKRKHGTGDTLSSVMVAELAKGCHVEQAIKRAKAYMNEILQHEIHVGQGHGPLNHWGAEGTDVEI
ncbi:bifunctional hydroxymethylpyrimidine kinase/phosphomethylpyrimidine kinase [Lactobacillus sp. Sy-1]|uniref:bifunctional hydroxymethylpyrimidine kinase/phosphomethylpyrimidine kinase n=1 Tax=Lactobacillus sp. Sy-1 TaxID=2109645 RepID=UPI001C5B0936|nr:bifunctional hydroxymethylpyrimidine kinase/phosphomethylpyrimidine kinase [Lactobacillus sp. Sy-1]MBW1606280.1 bifunctional hydroxymethylpyrimidine kinase/phosphomethylpyrimidine kinase [Lactobacillus sp. Sy-1]